jgi:DNA-directed RNA polymerase subunit RPC12/RpoP
MTRYHHDLERCVRCGNEFSAAANRAYPNVIVEAFSAKWLWTKITDSALVSCPRCDHGFQSDQVRFFGVLSLRQVRVVFLLCLVGLLAVSLFVAMASW